MDRPATGIGKSQIGSKTHSQLIWINTLMLPHWATGDRTTHAVTSLNSTSLAWSSLPSFHLLFHRRMFFFCTTWNAGLLIWLFLLNNFYFFKHFLRFSYKNIKFMCEQNCCVTSVYYDTFRFRGAKIGVFWFPLTFPKFWIFDRKKIFKMNKTKKLEN